MIQTVPARAPGPPLLLTLYVAALLALFATHLDLYLHETFQLPTSSAATVEPSTMSVRRDMPRHMTVLPGGGSLPRAR